MQLVVDDYIDDTANIYYVDDTSNIKSDAYEIGHK